MKFRRTAARFHASDGGAAMAEAAVVIPILVFLMIGVMDFGRAYSEIATAQKQLRSAGRYLSKLSLDRVCSTAGQNEARKLAYYGDPYAANGTRPVVPNWDSNFANNVTVTLDFSCTSTTPPTDGRITIGSNVPFTALAWGALGLQTTMTFSPQHVERWIGQ